MSMMCYGEEEGERRRPGEGFDREMVVPTVMPREQRLEIVEGVESLDSVEKLVVFTVTTLNFAVVSGRGDTNQLVMDTVVVQGDVKCRELVGTQEPVGELRAVVGLNACNRERIEA